MHGVYIIQILLFWYRTAGFMIRSMLCYLCECNSVDFFVRALIIQEFE